MKLRFTRTFGRRFTTVAATVAAALVLTATPANAVTTDNLSDTATWGWTSAVITWGDDSFHAGLNINVNDSKTDGVCVKGRISFYDYDGSTVLSNWSTNDCSVNGDAEYGYSNNINFYPKTVYSASLQLCQYNESNGTTLNCRTRKYAYR
ncbi:hypothetical protein [Catellatospora sp. NPDC049609]|uniref:hypothetical protein n=1 Tax=Catellatospora sp. NPDC049609 TaxID=3155505 RepID=UPI003438B5AD